MRIVTRSELKRIVFIPVISIIWLVTGYSFISAENTGENPINEMIDKFFSQLDSHFIEKKGSVIKVDNETVYINLGKNENITPGMQFNLYREGEEIHDPSNPNSCGYVMDFISSITIDLVQDSISSGSSASRENTGLMPVEGDVVITRQPFLKIGFTYQDNELYVGNNLLHVIGEILSYMCEKTGRYTVLPPEKFHEALQTGDGSDNWKQKILKTANWLNIDVIVALQLTQTEWDLGLNGYLLSVKDQRVIDFILSTMPKNPQISSILNDIQKKELPTTSSNFFSILPEISLRGSVLDACSHDINLDGKDELFVLMPEEFHIYFFSDGAFSETMIIKFPDKRYSDINQKIIMGKILVLDLDNDGVAECYARTSKFSVGYRWIYQEDSFRLYDYFYGYPIGVDITSNGDALLLAKNINGKDYFSGDLFYKYPGDGKLRSLTDPDRNFDPFYNFCTVYDPTTKNLTRIFLDVDNHIQFVTSAGGAYIQDREFGTGMAVGDIDNDHNPDFFVSSSSFPEEDDWVYWYEIEGNQIQLHWQSEPEKGSIYVLTIGDCDGNGKKDLIVFREYSSNLKITTTMKVYSN
ncbi:MAG: hypothetical protein A2161_16675 [Candidatus Schekmanbacteria bacterium RBG_13_48_7]|uniref:VCBS repeat-containing protein n=1 Tax=Candidatus Schekmanbacteria bacterium RBG_13_48_7 TaxID=1817878 RepID=A0A1F7RWU1_9BACT|nr:MAG: hypothetical protein A2161_16675 [Candidatus Schekmanbacteria bacterium RBG_13_48_7]